jgi:transposase-like protein
VSAATVKQIRQKSRERNEGIPLRTSGKKRPRKCERNIILDDFDFHVLKRAVIDFYVGTKDISVCKKLLPVIREKSIFLVRNSL